MKSPNPYTRHNRIGSGFVYAMHASSNSVPETNADALYSNWSKDVTKDKIRQAMPALSIVVATLLSACGDSDDAMNRGEPEIGTATESPSVTGRTVSGRVADGYIQGATVCLDLNDNDTCEANEPSAVTGVGGAYALNIPEGAQGSQVVADIPATAIDEDTGEAVGQPLVFVTPADRPEFISPITTLIRQAVKSNPALGSDEAEQSVKADLGLSDDDAVSLFEDYVAKADDDQVEPDEASRFRYVHETARVIASMMKDIQTQVGNAAELSGADVTGDDQTRQAIRELVRTEVRQLLPQIAEQVSQIVSIVQPADAEATESQNTTVVNSEQIALNLRPGNITDNINERIESIIDRPEATPVAMKSILSSGLYWIEFDCDHREAGIENPGLGNPVPDNPVPQNPETASAIDDDPDTVIPEDVESSEFSPECHAMYGHVQLDEAGEQLLSTSFEFDELSGAWIESINLTDDSDFSDFALVEGQWVPALNVEPNGATTFPADGSAIVTNANGEMRIKAVSQMLGGVPVERFLWHADDTSIMSGLDTDSNTLFNSGSEAYNLTVNSSSHEIILFNHSPPFSSDGNDCSQFGGNCNVVRANVNDQFTPVSTLEAIREASPNAIELAVSGYDGYNGQNSTLKLSAQGRADGNLPETGTATWTIDYQHSVNELTRPEIDLCQPEILLPLPENQIPGGVNESPEIVAPGSTDIDSPDNSQFSVKPDNEFIPPRTPEELLHELTNLSNEHPDLLEAAQEFNPDNPQDPCNLFGDDTFSADREPLPDTVTSSWRLVNLGTVSMIQVELPIALRHGSEHEGNSALLLIEQEGFVRLGARLNEADVDTVVTYNESAFVTLKEKLAARVTATSLQP